MKRTIAKIALLAAICISAASCGTPRIALDTTHKGDRVILTSDVRLFRANDGGMFAALGVKIAPKDTIMAILVTYTGDSKKGIFELDDKIRVRLNDGKEFALTNLYNREFENHTEVTSTERMQQNFDYAYSYNPWLDEIYLSPVSVTRWVPEVRTTKITRSYGLYPITWSQLEGIINKGVAKFRIESSIGDNDMPKPEELSDAFKSMAECIFSELTKNVKNADF